MKVLKRNQVIVLVIALMLVSAGYLNFASIDNENKQESTQTSVQESTIEYAGIGDAKLVSGNVSNENNVIQSIVPNENNVNEISKTTSSITTNTSDKKTEEYFSSSRLNRETMYSQMLETYQKILENELISSDQKAIAQTEIKNINDIKNKIMICENLIKIKEVDDVIIFVNDKSISVIVRADELKQEKIAQIQNIISREMQIEIDNIHISNK